jgi:hypothetical protein
MAPQPKKPSPAPFLLEEWEGVVESANETRHRLGRLYGHVEGRALKDPVHAMAWAIAAGFVLGGGVFSGLTLRVAGAAAKMALRACGAGLLARGLLELAPLAERLPPVEVSG